MITDYENMRKIVEIYYALWKSADFEEAFKQDWEMAYKRFDEGDAEYLSVSTLNGIIEWGRALFKNLF